jgi:hypothetical protein
MKSRLFIATMRSHSSYICLVNRLGVKVVRLGGSRFWVWGGGKGWDGVVSYYGFFSISCSASSLLCFLVGICYKSGVWVNLAVCLLHSVRIKKNIVWGSDVDAVYMEFTLKFTYLWEHAVSLTLSGDIPEVCTWRTVRHEAHGSAIEVWKTWAQPPFKNVNSHMSYSYF